MIHAVSGMIHAVSGMQNNAVECNSLLWKITSAKTKFKHEYKLHR